MQHRIVTITQVSGKKQQFLIPAISCGTSYGVSNIHFGEIQEALPQGVSSLKSDFRDMAHVLGMIALELNHLANADTLS